MGLHQELQRFPVGLVLIGAKSAFWQKHDASADGFEAHEFCAPIKTVHCCAHAGSVVEMSCAEEMTAKKAAVKTDGRNNMTADAGNINGWLDKTTDD